MNSIKCFVLTTEREVNTLSNFILTLKLNTEKYQQDILDKRLDISRTIYNSCLGELFKRYNTMRQSKEYQKTLKMIAGKERNKKFNELDKKYGLTEYSLHKFVKSVQHHFKNNIDSHTSQKIATRCFNAFQKLMFHQSKKVCFKRHGEMNSVEGKSNKSGIRFKDNKLMWNGLKIDVTIKNNDKYTQMALGNNIKYCRIVRKLIRGKHKYYVQLILDGVPPMKINNQTGEIKNGIGNGKVGIDIGTKTVAYASKHEVKLLELSPEINNIEKEKRILQRKLDRQRRANNPNNYNENGTVRVGGKSARLKWTKSKKYIKTQNKLREIQRKQADIRKQSHNKLANHIVSLGNEVYVETMDYKELQYRGSNTNKKRLGKSIANKAPSMFLTILDNKLKWHNKRLLKINTTKIKASQYNHVKDEYIKKDLSERWNDFGNFKIQRDLYSSFIIMCTKDNLKETDKKLCIKEFENFKMLHDVEIERIKNSKSKTIYSMGI